MIEKLRCGTPDGILRRGYSLERVGQGPGRSDTRAPKKSAECGDVSVLTLVV